MTDKFLIDSHKLMFHPERTSQVLAADNWGKAQSVYPLYVEVSPAGSCNARCTFCAVDYIGYVKRYLDADIYEQRVKEMGALGVKSIMFAGEGEPMLHPKITKIVTDTYFAGLDTAFTTNGTLMTKTFVDHTLQFINWIKVSLNAGTAETYAKVHQVKKKEFHKVLSNLEYAVEYKHKYGAHCTLGAQSVLLPENAHEMYRLAKQCKLIGLDYVVVKPYSQHKFSDTHQYEGTNYTQYLELEEQLAGLNDDDFTVVFRSNTIQKLQESTPYEKCMSTPFLWAYIMASGDVYSCSAYLEQEKFNLGNIHTQGFQEIWEGEKRRQNFEFVTKKLDISECRKNCRMDSCNRFLDSIKNDKIQHVNFI